MKQRVRQKRKECFCLGWRMLKRKGTNNCVNLLYYAQETLAQTYTINNSEQIHTCRCYAKSTTTKIVGIIARYLSGQLTCACTKIYNWKQKYTYWRGISCIAFQTRKHESPRIRILHLNHIYTILKKPSRNISKTRPAMLHTLGRRQEQKGLRTQYQMRRREDCMLDQEEIGIDIQVMEKLCQRQKTKKSPTL